MAYNPGIFEPFYLYVRRQLNIRKAIISNYVEGKGDELRLRGDKKIDDYNRFDTNSVVWGSRDKEGVFVEYDEEVLNEKGLENFYNIDPTSFYKLVTEKQCVIQMASGVDIKKENTILDPLNIVEFSGNQMARNYTLSSKGWMGAHNRAYGTDLIAPTYDDTYEGTRGGVNVDVVGEDDYADKFRTHAKDGFGHVPQAGITSINVSTKSEDGSLREATVEFVCHNRRQLEILEALYMRPGYPILLQWGWTSYIDNDFQAKNSNYDIPDKFYQKNSTFKEINDIIRERKKESGGNYDGFLGYCKNFSFKVREDGGYNCTTEIMAQAEMLASLKAATRVIPKIISYGDLGNNKQVKRDKDGEIIETTYYDTDTEVITVDDFLYYLKSIKSNLDKAGDEIFLNKLGSKMERRDTVKDIYPDMPWWKRIWYFQPSTYTIYDKNDNPIDITQLNQVADVYVEGIYEVYQLIQDVKKISMKDIEQTYKGYYDIPDFLRDQQHSGKYRMVGYGEKNRNYNIYQTGKTGQFYRNNFLGFDSYCKGLIMKEMQLESDPTENDSGIRKKIYVRWDLICQILNRRVTPEYKKHHALSELTYLLPNQPTFQDSPNEEGQKEIAGGELQYIEYTRPDSSPLFPGDKTGLPPVGGSFDFNICIFPHQLSALNDLMLNNPDMGKKTEGPYNNYEEITGMDNDGTIDSTGMFEDTYNFSSFKNVKFTSHGIGQIHFNLDYLIETYEDLVLEEYTTSNDLGEEKTKRRLKKEFNFHDWITTIWNGVNESTGGYYDFGLHSEHERPHVARIIDFTFQGQSDDFDGIFEFDPQGLFSVSRNVTFQSKLDEDFASAVSIAAQASADINSLEALSFKSFHTDIKNRFTNAKFDQEERLKTISSSLADYTASIEEYKKTINTLNYYKQRMYKSNYESELVVKNGKELLKKPLAPEAAKDLAKSLGEMRIEIESRYPEFVDKEQTIKWDGSKEVDGHYTGEYRKGTTHYRNAIIPITTTIELDGIGGISPLNIFKIAPEKLPLGYQNPNIVFVVKQESQKVTSGQDWTTTITGYLTLLNDNPNLGSNSENIKILEQIKEKKLNDRNAYNKRVTDIPWSAMFVSYVVLEAATQNYGQGGTTRIPIFAKSAAHTSYFEKNKNNTDYTHMDPKITALRVGDILLQSRKGGSSKGVKYPGSYSGKSHADIVVSINDTSGLVTLVGGNVNNKVKKKTFTAKSVNNNPPTILDENNNEIPNPNFVASWVCSPEGGKDSTHGAYYDGSLLRAREEIHGTQIAAQAQEELDAWDSSWVETSIDAEETMRKYFKEGGGIDLPETKYD